MHHGRLIGERSGFTMLELMIVIAIIGLLAAIAIPNFIAYRNKSCYVQAETDADHVAGAIADYFGNGNRVNTPALDDLKVNVLNSVDIIGTDPNLHITVQVTDVSGRCPSEYQSGHPGWNGVNVFVKEIR